jgi:hypothetical protein
MDKGAENTQKIVIAGAIILAIIIVIIIGYSLYVKAIRAEGELANKVALDQQTAKQGAASNISLTGESQNSSNFTYDGLVQRKTNTATTTNFEIVNETAPVEVPTESTPVEEAIPPEENDYTPVEPAPTPKPTSYSDDRPLTAEEIQRIRALPIDDSPSGSLQTSLEEESQGQYRARY